MRFVSGLIVGILLTIGTAYVADAMHGGASADGHEARQMVNWSVVNANMRDLSTNIHEAWTNLVGKSRELDKETGV